MSNKVIINGNEYSYGEIVESELFDDKSKEIVLNGEVVKVGDVWLTRELKEVLITSINTGCWPIRDNKDHTYSVYGIVDSSHKISGQDLMTKYVKDIPYTEDAEDTDDTEDVEDVEDTEDVEDVNDTEDADDTEAVNDTEDVEAVKDTVAVNYADNGIDALPILDIQIGDVWETRGGKEVEIISHNPVGEFEWVSAEGLSYTNKGTYFSSSISLTKDLVTRVLRTTEIKEEATEVDEAPVLDMPSNYADALRHSTIYVKDDAIDASRYAIFTDACTEDTTINFENAVRMHMDSIVSLIGDRICEKVKSRDVSTVKYLTKVLEKVIDLEKL